jgi:hypothetical protein
MKILALVLFLTLASSGAASEAAKNHDTGGAPPSDSAKSAKAAEENAGAGTAKSDSRPRSGTPRRIPYHMLMIR